LNEIIYNARVKAKSIKFLSEINVAISSDFPLQTPIPLLDSKARALAVK